MIYRISICFFMTLIFGIGITSCGEGENENNADIIIYGGTSAAIIAAVEAVQNGNSVIVVSPDTHLGGLTSGGAGIYRHGG